MLRIHGEACALYYFFKCMDFMYNLAEKVVYCTANTRKSSMETKVSIFSQGFGFYFAGIVVVFALVSSSSTGSLSFDFYAASCPNVEFMVSNTIRLASSDDPTVPGKLLRLLFHDCFVEGCDASVLLQGNNTERSDPANKSLGGFSVIDSAKRLVELFCPSMVSCADILALAARDAVAFAGGPVINIPTGRRDGRISAVANVRPNMIDTSFTMDDMIKIFSSKGLSLVDLVVLSGAHTIGEAHCSVFSNRFTEDSNGNLKPVDSSLDIGYANDLIKQCPIGTSAATTVNNDPETSSAFDNQYYRNLLARKGLFQSDSVLSFDQRTRKLVEDFANDEARFFESWSQSFQKLTSIGVKTGEEGEIRRSCSAVNG